MQVPKLKMKSITERCAGWNSQRYEQEYNHDLALSLLLEELNELYSAPNDVERLDAIGDITFVAMGVFWKLKVHPQLLHDIFHLPNLEVATPEELYGWTMQVEYMILGHKNIGTIPGAYPGINMALTSVFIIAIPYLRAMGLQKEFFNIVHAICQSNETKEVKGKVDASVKANIIKGTTFVPPTEQLKVILQRKEEVNE